ncbi:MAG: chorismate synthase [Anaerolineae bacterium]|nr:chorismate synthase [Anaerolineae bacterium]
MLRFLTAGESHGPALLGIIEGLPAGLPLTPEDLTADLARRQAGYGRGARQQIEADRAEIVAGVLGGVTTGAPVALRIANRARPEFGDAARAPRSVPQPGHAELAGALKYGFTNVEGVAERASARETAMRVAIGAVAKKLLGAAGIGVVGYVVAIGEVSAEETDVPLEERAAQADGSPVRCLDPEASRAMVAAIDAAREAGDTLGGVVEVVAWGLPPGLGSYVHPDRRLDARLGAAVLSIPAIKGVEIGPAFANARLRGTQVHDPIRRAEGRIVRPTNRAGGLEGGMTNGEPLVVRAAMKPIPTTLRPQPSIDLAASAEAETVYRRSDICAVPAASVVAAAAVAWVVADALIECCGGDRLEQVVERVAAIRGEMRRGRE